MVDTKNQTNDFANAMCIIHLQVKALCNSQNSKPSYLESLVNQLLESLL